MAFGGIAGGMEAAYEGMGASLLAQAIPFLTADRERGDPNWPEVRTRLEARLYALRSWRLSWWQHWAQLALNILPRRYHWLITPNQMSRGLPINQNIVDPTAAQAVRVCAAGMKNGLMSSSRPWFNLKPAISNFTVDRAGQLWFDAVQDRIYTVMSDSNYYDAGTQQFEDLVVFGTAPKLIYEDQRDIIRCYNPCAGEYYLAAGPDGRVESFYRTFVMTVAQIVEMFGLENVDHEVAELWEAKGASLETEFIVAHAIEPNFSLSRRDDRDKNMGVVPGGFAFREIYWLWARNSNKPLSSRGFHEQPFSSPRWATTSNDAYGRSPAMDALPDVMQLQIMTKRLAEAVEKMIRPPMQADISLQNKPSSILPGHITYVTNVEKGGMRPIFEVNPQIQQMVETIKEIQQRIGKWFYNDLFLMLAQMEGVQPRNELEINERRGEKLQVLGPVIEKFQNEGASTDIRRIAGIMRRKGLLPPKPPSLRGVPVEIEYTSMLALSQRAAATASIERALMFTAQMAPSFPDRPPLDNIDSDEVVRDYWDKLSNPQKLLFSQADVVKARAVRAKQMAQQQQEAAQMQAVTHALPAAAGAAKDLSSTDVGGGLNASEIVSGMGGQMGLQ